MITRDQIEIRDARRDHSACLLATTTDDETGAGNVTTVTGTETVAGTGKGTGTEEINIGTHVGRAVLEVLEGVIMIDVQVRKISVHLSVAIFTGSREGQGRPSSERQTGL